MEISSVRSLISTDDGELLSPADFSAPEQLTLLTHWEKCQLLRRVYRREGNRTGDRIYYDNAVFCSSTMIRISGEDYLLRKKSLYYHGDDSVARNSRYNDATDLETAIQSLEECLMKDDEEKGPVNLDGRDRANALNAYSQCRKLRYIDMASEEDIDAAFRALDEAEEIYNTLDGINRAGDCALSRANLFEAKFLQNKGVVELLEKAISHAEESVVLTKGQRLWQECMEGVARLYEQLSHANKDEDGFLIAIETIEELFSVQRKERQMARYHFQLGRLYLLLTQMTFSPDHGSEASSNIRASLRLTPPDDPERPERVQGWERCVDYLSRNDRLGFDWRGRPTNAEIAMQRRVIAETLEDNNGLKAQLLGELSSMYQARYVSGEASAEAIAAREALKEAIELTPADDHEELLHRTRTVAIMCNDHWCDKETPVYLEEAVVWGRRCVAVCETATDAEDSTKALNYAAAAKILALKFDEDNHQDKAIAGEAMEYYNRALELISSCCQADDGCQHCQDKKVILGGLESFKRVVERQKTAPAGGQVESGDEGEYSHSE